MYRSITVNSWWGATSLVALLATTSCGGAIEFRDNAAIQIQGAAPPPPPEPKPKPRPIARVEVRDNSIEIKERIQFAYNDATILDVSYSLLDEVGKVVKENPHVKTIEIGGHASSEGDDTHNLKLSEQRAGSVRQYLVDKAGVPPDRLTSKGYGETKPLVTPDDTEDKRLKNRRVEFIITSQDVTKKQVSVDASTGKETVVESSTSTLKPKQ